MTYCDAATTDYHDGHAFFIPRLPASSPAGSAVPTPATPSAAVRGSARGSGRT